MPLKDPEARKAYDRARSAANAAKKRQQARESYYRHQARNRAQARAYHVAHREELNAKRRAKRLANPEYYRAQKRASREKHREKNNANNRAKYRENPEMKIEEVKARRARKYGAKLSDFSMAQWREIKSMYNYLCVYCGKKPKKLTMDHIIPISRGGSHTASNIVPACMSCNASKKSGPPPKPVQPLLLTIALKKRSRKKPLT